MSYTTQTPSFALNVQTTSRGVTFSIRSGAQTIPVTILPDAQGRSNYTHIRMNPVFNLRRDISWSTTTERHHRIERAGSVLRPLRWTLSIQTFYSQDSSLTSAYGRGTTPADIQAGNTSLAFHESQHGALILNHLNAQPLPALTIVAGSTRQQATGSLHRFHRDLRHYQQRLRQLEISEVDCPGIPMNEQTCR